MRHVDWYLAQGDEESAEGMQVNFWVHMDAGACRPGFGLTPRRHDARACRPGCGTGRWGGRGGMLSGFHGKDVKNSKDVG